MSDSVDKLVIFLAKRDGIDKLVKTFQYVSKLAHWRLESRNPNLASRAKNLEIAAGLSRKAFRTGRFLTGFNALRRNPSENLAFQILSLLANSGEMVYFFFDHFLWLARVGVIDANLARRMSFVSAFGESFGYVWFIVADVILVRRGLQKEREVRRLKKDETVSSDGETKSETERVVEGIQGDRVMRMMGMAANLADLVIGLADIEPNPFCKHAVTLGISGLVSAWAGWYRNWPT